MRLQPAGGVDGLAVDDDLEVEVAAGGVAGGPGDPDESTGPHGLTRLHPEALKVVVGGLQAVSVINDDAVTAPIGAESRFGDRPGRRAEHRGVAPCREVDTRVQFRSPTGQRVDSVPEKASWPPCWPRAH